MHALFLHAWAYILAGMGPIRAKGVSTQSGRLAGHLEHISKPLHTFFLPDWAYILAQLDQTGELEILVESGKHAKFKSTYDDPSQQGDVH